MGFSSGQHSVTMSIGHLFECVLMWIWTLATKTKEKRK